MDNENLSKMARFISELRKEKGLTQKELASQLGVTDKAVSKWERGLGCPDISLLSKLSHLLGVTANELLSGEKAESSSPEVEAVVEATLQYADAAAKGAIARSRRWKPAAVGSVGLLSGVLILLGCNSLLDGGPDRFVLPVSLIGFAWLASLLAAFVMGKNRISSLLLCGLLIYMTTFYYAALNEAPGVSHGFMKGYIPHYTVILVMFLVSAAMAALPFLIKRPAGDVLFLQTAACVTLIILSVITVPSIMDYVDINALGVDGRFTILILLTILLNCVSLALLARRYRRRTASRKRADETNCTD